MNLLSFSNNNESKIYDSIMVELKGLMEETSLTQEDIEIAEKFFDFSKDTDYSLLDGIKVREFKNPMLYKRSLYDTFNQMVKANDMKYTDRFMLFLDAAAGNTFAPKIVYSAHYIYNSGDRFETVFIDRIMHAYEQRFGSDIAKMKYCALMAYAEETKACFSNSFLDFIKENPETAYNSIKYCFGTNTLIGSRYFDKLRIYSAILWFYGCDKSGIFTAEQIDEMAENVVQIAENVMKNNKVDLAEICLFMAAKSNKNALECIKAKVKGNEKTFINNFFKNVSFAKAEDFDIFGEILDLEDKGTALKCIHAVINATYSGIYGYFSYKNNYGASLLSVFAKKCPKEYIYVMRKKDALILSSKNAKRFTCSYYKPLYDILEKSNRQAITDYNVDYIGDVIKIAVSCETAFSADEKPISEDEKKEIENFLTFKTDISAIEPYFSEIKAMTSLYSDDIVHAQCMLMALEEYPKYYSRYLILKVLQKKFGVFTNYGSNAAAKSNDEYYSKLKYKAEIMIDGKIPVKLRFEVYDAIINYVYGEEEKKSLRKIILESMVKNSAEFDDDYAQICPESAVFIREIYVDYLKITDTNGKNFDRLLEMCSDSGSVVKYTAVQAIVNMTSGEKMNEEYEKKVIALLNSKKLSVRESAVNILSSWGAEKYKDVLGAAAEKEKSARLAEKINDIIANADDGESKDGKNGKDFSVISCIERLHKGGRNRKVLWLYSTQNPQVHLKDGSIADDKYMQAILLCYSGMAAFDVSEEANLLANNLDKDELCRYAAEIFSKWHSLGSDSKTRWVINFAAIHGGSNMIDTLLGCIKEWAENMRGAIAAAAVNAIALNGSSQALMAVDNLAHKFKHKQVKNAAISAMDTAAEALGITPDELGDRIIPNLGFDENMERIFDYGTRKFKVYINPSLELEVYDENDKKLKTMPAPGKKDDEQTAKAANAEFKQMKKQLKNVVSIQKMRLENVLLSDRRWKKEAWENLFVKNPVMHSFAVGLIWTAYQEGEIIQTFRYMEDGTFNTVDEDEFEIPENAVIGLSHPIEMDEETLSAWKEQISDYEIVQPIEQLERKVYRIEEDEKKKNVLTRFKGRKLVDLTLLGRMTKFGWYKGSIQDAGCFGEFYREDVTERRKLSDGKIILIGNAVEVSFSGMYVSGMGEEVEIEDVRFYNPGNVARGSYVYDSAENQKSIILEKIPPRYFSEIINQLDIITKTSENNDD